MPFVRKAWLLSAILSLSAARPKLSLGGKGPLTPLRRPRALSSRLLAVSNEGLGVDSTLQLLRERLPFLSEADAETICSPLVRYEGPLDKCEGREQLSARHRLWREEIPRRLEDLEIDSRSFNVLSASAELVVGQQVYDTSFRARIPPPAIARLQEIGEVAPGGYIDCKIRMQSEFRIDGQTGQVLSQQDRLIDDSWDVRSTIARTEFLLARRPPRRDPITWYWDVLRLQTRDEWSAAGFGAGNDGKDFEYAFASMIFRQFAIGGGLGILIFASAKLLRSYLDYGGLH